MNRFFKYLMLGCLISLIVLGCSEEDEYVSSHEWWLENSFGEISALMNGAPWGAQALILGFDHPPEGVIAHPNLAISIRTFNEFGFERLEFSFQQVPCEVGKYEIKHRNPNTTDLPTVGLTTVIDDGDVAGDRYNIDTTKVNFIEISELTEDSGVFGSFELNLVRDSSRPRTSFTFPDTIHFSEGYFHTKLMPR